MTPVWGVRAATLDHLKSAGTSTPVNVFKPKCSAYTRRHICSSCEDMHPALSCPPPPPPPVQQHLTGGATAASGPFLVTRMSYNCVVPWLVPCIACLHTCAMVLYCVVFVAGGVAVMSGRLVGSCRLVIRHAGVILAWTRMICYRSC